MSASSLTDRVDSLSEMVDTLDPPPAAVRDLVAGIRERVAGVARVCGEAEQAAQRWSPALPVPEWARRLRSLVGGRPWSRPGAERQGWAEVEPVTSMVHRAIDGLGISAAEAARRTGFSPMAVTSWQRGDRHPSAETLMSFFRALGYEPVVVLDGGHLAADASAGEMLRRRGWRPPSSS